jgi:iron(III) transport system ATP-binding protein
VLALVGPSGCGKSTLLRLIAGLEDLQAGQISLEGQPVANATGRLNVPPDQRRVGLVFQDYALFPHMTIACNVSFGLDRIAKAEREALVDTLLAAVGMARYRDAYPHQLSGGQQQRIALVRAMAPNPALLLLDEPFSGLDVSLRRRISRQTIALIRKVGAAAILVTHDLEEAMATADRMAVMVPGAILQLDQPAQIYRAPASPDVAGLFGEVNRFNTVAQAGRAACPLGEVKTPDASNGARLSILIRPEAVQIGQGAIPAHITDVRTMGFYTDLTLHLTDAQPPVLARVAGRYDGRTGDTVTVGIDPDLTLVFPSP